MTLSLYLDHNTNKFNSFGSANYTKKFLSGPFKIGLIGDSIQAANSYSTDKKTSYESNGIITNFQYRNFKRFTFKPAYNKGIGGDTVGNFRATNLQMIDELVELGISILVDSYGRNDISAGRTAQEIFEDRIAIHDYAFNRGIQEIWVETVKPSSYSSATTRYNLRALALNEMLLRNTMIDTRKQFIDTWSKTVSSDYNLVSGYSYDGIHFTPAGAIHASEAYSETINPIYGIGTAPNAEIGNIFNNGALEGVNGAAASSVHGDVADQMTVRFHGTHNSKTVTCSKIPEGGQRLKLRVASGATHNEYCSFQTIITDGLRDNQVYTVSAIGQPISSSGNAYWYGIQVNCRDENGTTLHSFTDMDKRDENALIDFNAIPEGLLQTPSFLTPKGTKALDVRLVIGGDARKKPLYMEVIWKQLTVSCSVLHT